MRVIALFITVPGKGCAQRPDFPSHRQHRPPGAGITPGRLSAVQAVGRLAPALLSLAAPSGGAREAVVPPVLSGTGTGSSRARGLSSLCSEARSHVEVPRRGREPPFCCRQARWEEKTSEQERRACEGAAFAGESPPPSARLAASSSFFQNPKGSARRRRKPRFSFKRGGRGVLRPGCSGGCGFQAPLPPQELHQDLRGSRGLLGDGRG